MKTNEIEKLIADQCSSLRAFPSQGPTIDQMFSGRNQRASIEMQIELAKLSSSHDKKLERMSETLSSLVGWAAQHQLALKERELVDDQRYKETTRLNRRATWAAIVSAVLAAIAIITQMAFK